MTIPALPPLDLADLESASAERLATAETNFNIAQAALETMTLA